MIKKDDEYINDSYTVYQNSDLADYNGVVYPKKAKNTWRIILCAVAFIIIFFFVAVFSAAESVYIKTYVRGPSMMPTLNVDFDSSQPNKQLDIVYLNSYDKGKAGDIVVDNYVVSQDVQFVIKRIIATEGDTLRIIVPDDNEEPTKVYVNGKLISEPYINEPHFNGLTFLTDSQIINEQNYSKFKPVGNSKDGTITIPKGYVFYMGDNRNNSSDCRSTGPRVAKGIVGKVDFIVQHNVDKNLTDKDLFWPGVNAIFNYIGESIKNFFKIK